MVKWFISFYAIVFFTGAAWSQTDPLQYVNPFIGTTQSNVFTKWGSEGGTYPGAVAPWGAVQLTPETRLTGSKGYDYRDSSIYFFSCTRHLSGFPSGSSGSVYVMPVKASDSFRLNTYHRYFNHKNEKATPGYYRVLFDDDNTLVEATAGERTGHFRFTFPAQVIPKLFIGDAGKLTVRSNKELSGAASNTLFRFNKNFTNKEDVSRGCMLTFGRSTSGTTVIELQIGVSAVSVDGAVKNLTAVDGDFGELKKSTQNKWRKALSVVDIDDTSEANKTVFYSALYHASLVPWVVSDVDGKYRGADKRVYQAKGANQYNVFSPWDTFRTLHPLLCLLFPERQKDMIESMLDIYRQTGYLPTESMTGNHAIPIITDSWLKGIKVADSLLAFTAMRKSILSGPYIQPDMEIYRMLGYIPFSYPESVTRTVEYAYDDWALAQFARALHHNDFSKFVLKKSFNYRNLFNASELFLLPRKRNEFKLQPGTFGYKEGDAWVYSYFVPHNAKDLVNIMGGDTAFVSKLDSGLITNQLVFDNETMFHVPYLFNFTNESYKTQEWVQNIMRTRFSATPGGLPGNDDLGSTSSWFVFSAMGIYPVCPGRPVYAISAPLFRSVTVHMANGKQWVIKANNTSPQYKYIKSITVNGAPYPRVWLPHTMLVQGGQMEFDMDTVPHREWVLDKDLTDVSGTTGDPAFQLINFSVTKNNVLPNEQVAARFVIQNKGSAGIKRVTVYVNGKAYAAKNCLVPADSTITDSISFRLYPFGKTSIQVDEAAAKEIGVVHSQTATAVQPVISGLVIKPVIRTGEMQRITYDVQNTDGEAHIFYIPIHINDSLACTDTITLQPGAIQHMVHIIPVKNEGLQNLRVDNTGALFKVYSNNLKSILLSLSADDLKDSVVADSSGFGNEARVVRMNGTSTALSTSKVDSSPLRLLSMQGVYPFNKRWKLRTGLVVNKDRYIEVPGSLSVDSMGQTITMMLWVYPIGKSNGLVDVFTKGDYHVLQVAGNKQLTFFAGGWGRGECTAALPANWFNNWHHIAGVCDGANLRLYIDGKLKGELPLQDRVNLSAPNKFTIGRNEEFPGQRIFDGYVDNVKLYAAPLSGDEVLRVVNEEIKSIRTFP